MRVFFDKIVAVTGAPTLALSIGTHSRPATFSGLSWSNTEGWSALRFRYYVQAEDGDRDGIGIAAGGLHLNGGAIRDAGGTDAALHLDDHAIAGDPTHKVDGSIDTTTPAVTDVFFDSAPSRSNVYGLGDRLQAVVRMNELVAIAGAPQLALTIGSQSRLATFDVARRSTDNVSHLYFSYVVQAADRDADGVSITANALRLNGGFIRDPAGNNARLDLGRHAIDNAAGHAVDGGEKSSADRNGFSPD